MLAAVGSAATTVGRFVRRHRRKLVFGGLAGAAAWGYWRVRRLLLEAEALQQALRARTLEEERFLRYLGRARTECLTAVINFLPTLRKRLFEAIDVNGPVRELKRLRRSSRPGPGDTSLDEDLREAELWEEVKVTGLARLLAGLYLVGALNMMLRLQLHILGRHSFEEWLQMFRGDAEAAFSDATTQEEGAAASAAAAAAASADAAAAATAEGEGAFRKAAPAGLSMESRHAFLSSTYEFMLGDGLRALVTDVQCAVREHTAHWQLHKGMAVPYDEFVSTLRSVRAAIEGGSDAQVGAALLPYIISPRESSPGAAEGEAERDPEVQTMLDETWDAAESPNFGFALADSVDAMFAVLLERLQEKVFAQPPAVQVVYTRDGVSVVDVAAAVAAAEGEAAAASVQDISSAGSGMEDGNLATGGQAPSPPLATALSQLKVVVAGMLDATERNEYCGAVASLPSVTSLCTAVFGQLTPSP